MRHLEWRCTNRDQGVTLLPLMGGGVVVDTEEERLLLFVDEARLDVKHHDLHVVARLG